LTKSVAQGGRITPPGLRDDYATERSTEQPQGVVFADAPWCGWPVFGLYSRCFVDYFRERQVIL